MYVLTYVTSLIMINRWVNFVYVLRHSFTGKAYLAGGVHSYIHVLLDRFLFKLIKFNLILKKLVRHKLMFTKIFHGEGNHFNSRSFINSQNSQVQRKPKRLT